MLLTPVMTIDKYADTVGVSVDVVRGWQARGYLPTVRVGKYTLVNLLAIARVCEGASSFAKPEPYRMSPAGTGAPPASPLCGRRQAPAEGAPMPPPSKHGVSSAGLGGQEEGV